MKSTSIAYLKRSSFRIKWNLREVYKVTQFKEGAVYRTRSMGYIVCTREYAEYLQFNAGRFIQVGSVSTSITSQL